MDSPSCDTSRSEFSEAFTGQFRPTDHIRLYIVFPSNIRSSDFGQYQTDTDTEDWISAPLDINTVKHAVHLQQKSIQSTGFLKHSRLL